MFLLGTIRSRLPLAAAIAGALAALALLAVTAPGAQAKTIKLKGDETALRLDPGTASALTGAGYALAPVRAARARDDGSIAFPITRGRVNARTLAGFIAHSGGLSISRGDTKVVVRAFVIRTDAKRPFLTARAGKTRIRLLNLSRIERSDSNGKVVVTARVTLARQAAKALNGAFGTTLFKPGLPIGSATVTASG
jgi:hypothetical protein